MHSPCYLAVTRYSQGKHTQTTARLQYKPILGSRRVPGLVHEGSCLWMDNDPTSPVDLDYRPRGVTNVYVTGGGLWPTSGSWNPTLTMVALAQDLADRLSKR
jgi:choline dehydrogenase-like flavoprotein